MDPENKVEVYFGSIKCSSIIKSTNKPCKNGAYYSFEENYFCGVHCKDKNKVKLEKNPNKKNEDEELINERNLLIKKTKNENKGNKGNIICSKMKMMTKIPHIDGYLKVFPNYKHQNRKDGFGCSSLSPMNLGPVIHGQPDLPDSINLENFHQSSKCFSVQITDGKPNKKFYKYQKKMFRTEKGERHNKYASKKNIPEYFVWIDKDKKEHYLDYITSRQFYCNFYERLAKETEDFKSLERK